MDQLTGWEVAKFLWGLLITVLGFVGVVQMRRIDRLEESRATRKELNEKVDSLRASVSEAKIEMVRSCDQMRDDMKEHRQESREMMGGLAKRLDQLLDMRPFGHR